MGHAESLVIKNGRVLLPNGRLESVDVLIAGGSIRKVRPAIVADTKLDAAGAYILPGLIDLHTHGIHYERAESCSLRKYAALEAACGTTTFYLTFFAPARQTAAQLERHRRETNELKDTPNVAGFRLESPYLALVGGGLSEDIAPISPETTDMLLKAGGGHIRIWDFSPELPGAIETIRRLSAMGIVCSLAHTLANIEQGRAAVDAGASLATHLFCCYGVPQVVEAGVVPPGLVDYLLIDDRVACEIIADGTHVNPIMVEKALRCKGPQRIAFITDSNLGAGLPPGEYSMPQDSRRLLVRGKNDGVRAFDQNLGLSGSALTPIDVFHNVLDLFGKDLATAAQVCSTTPARVMGLNKGEIAPGRDADLILLDKKYQLVYTITGGEIIYQK
jgi:N-acetylglucosamine-6-phosphate deacetylase